MYTIPLPIAIAGRNPRLSGALGHQPRVAHLESLQEPMMLFKVYVSNYCTGNTPPPRSGLGSTVPDFARSHDRLDHPSQAPNTQRRSVHGDKLATPRIESACFDRRDAVSELVLELHRRVRYLEGSHADGGRGSTPACRSCLKKKRRGRMERRKGGGERRRSEIRCVVLEITRARQAFEKVPDTQRYTTGGFVACRRTDKKHAAHEASAGNPALRRFAFSSELRALNW